MASSRDNNPGKRVPVQTVIPSPQVDASLPHSGDVLSVNTVGASPSVDANLPSAGSVVSSAQVTPSPSIDANLPSASDVSVAGVVRGESPSVDANLPQAGDTERVRLAPAFSPVDANLPNAPDSHRVNTVTASPSVDANLPNAGDEFTVRVEPARSGVDANLPSAGDTERVRPVPARQGMDANLPQAPDTVKVQALPQAHEMQTDLPQAPDTMRAVVLTPPPQVDTRGIAADFGDEREQRFQANFSGAWTPDWNGVNVGPENYQTLQNLRYRDDGLEGVDGTSRINAVATGKELTAGIQLRTNYTPSSYILVQGQDSDGTNRIVAKHTGAVPSAANFDTLYTFVVELGSNDRLCFYSRWGGVDSANTVIMLAPGEKSGTVLAGAITAAMNANGTLTQGWMLSFVCAYSAGAFTITCTGGTIAYVHSLSTAGPLIGYTANKALATSITTDTAPGNDVPFYTESATAQRGRFSKLPQGHVGFCDQQTNLIWAGEEMAAAAVLLTKSIAIDSTATATITANGLRDYTKAAQIDATDAGSLIPLQPAISIGVSGTIYNIEKTDDSVTYTCTSGTPQFVTNGLKTGMVITITVTAFAAANQGTFTATAVTEDSFTILNPDGTTEYNKVLDADDTLAVISDMLVVGSTRLLSAITPYFEAANANTRTSTMTAYTYTASGWTSCLGTDGSASDGITLATSGAEITLTDVSAIPVILGGRQLYFYLLVPTNCDASLTRLTVRADVQLLRDAWDGIYRTAGLFYVRRATAPKDCEYTLDIVDASPHASPVGAEFGGLTTSEYAVAVFDERTSGFRVTLASEKTNDAAAVCKIFYWNGGAWQPVSGMVDGTAVSGVSLTQSGLITWDAVPEAYERRAKFRGVDGYAYKLAWSAQLNNEPPARETVIVDTFSGIPAARVLPERYVFPAMYRNRACWGGSLADGEENRMDYSAKGKPDVYNGTDASGARHERSLYFGSREPLTCFAELFNQFADGLDSVGIALKATETYILTGDAPEEFKIRTLSHSIGCPAPLTLDTAEVAVGSPNAAKQNVAVWMDGSVGPVLCNGGTIQPIAGDMVRRYWTPGSEYAIPAAHLDKAAGIYDPDYNVYHLVIPSGSTATKNNVWLCYDLGRGKWFEILTGDDFPQAFLRAEDDYGKQYVYALTDSGYMLRLNYGRTWSDGTAITYTVKTGDALFTKSPWDEVEVRRLKVLFAANAEGSLTVNHYLNGDDTATGTTGITATPRLGYANVMSRTGGHSYRNLILQLAGRTDAGAQTALRGLTHAFEFIVTGCTVTKPKLLAWGAQFIPVREDTDDMG